MHYLFPSLTGINFNIGKRLHSTSRTAGSRPLAGINFNPFFILTLFVSVFPSPHGDNFNVINYECANSAQ